FDVAFADAAVTNDAPTRGDTASRESSAGETEAAQEGAGQDPQSPPGVLGPSESGGSPLAVEQSAEDRTEKNAVDTVALDTPEMRALTDEVFAALKLADLMPI